MIRPGDEPDSDRLRHGGDLYEAEIGDRAPSEAVVDAVAAITDTEPTDLEPLFRTVDPEALDRLCTNQEASACPTVQFDYEGLVVTVSASDVITVVEP